MENDFYDPVTNTTIHKTGVCSTVPYENTTAIQVKFYVHENCRTDDC